jgi:hypothetical protein
MCLDLDGTPEREDLVAEVQPDVVESGNGPEAGVPEDEGASGGGHPVTLRGGGY